MKIRAVRDISTYSLVEVDRRFRGACCLHNQGDDDDDDNGGSKSKAVPLHAMEALGGEEV
jgi:hypothetical protein